MEEYDCREFHLAQYMRLVQSLPQLGRKVPAGERVSEESVQRDGSVVLGEDLVITSAKSRPNLYPTHSQLVLGRTDMPYSNGLAWMEGWDGVAHQLCGTVHLFRLQRIKQLSLLSFPVIQGQAICSMDFGHTRFLHTGDVYANGVLCAHNVGVQGKDMLALRIALAIHDLFTPACGDLMKFIDYKRYDEDAQLSQLLEDTYYLRMCEKLGVDPKEPIRICQQKDGTLCQIRDFADTYAYTARDLQRFLGSFLADIDCPNWYENPEEQVLLERLWRFQKNCTFTLWESIKTDGDGNLVFTDVNKLHEFLSARACLFRLLYYNRQTRNIEYLLGIRFVKMLLDEGFFRHEDFIGPDSGDDIIWWRAYERTGYNSSFMHVGLLGQTHTFHSLDTAQEFVRGNTDNRTCGLIYTWPSATKSKVNYWKVEMEDGTQVPWGEAYPEEAAEIERTMTLHPGYFVAIFRKEKMHQIKPEYWSKLKQLETSVL